MQGQVTVGILVGENRPCDHIQPGVIVLPDHQHVVSGLQELVLEDHGQGKIGRRLGCSVQETGPGGIRHRVDRSDAGGTVGHLRCSVGMAEIHDPLSADGPVTRVHADHLTVGLVSPVELRYSGVDFGEGSKFPGGIPLQLQDFCRFHRKLHRL